MTVSYRLVVDWVRHRHGRRSTRPPAGLTPLQERIFAHVFLERRSHTETYGLVGDSAGAGLPFAAYLRELAQTYRAVEASRAGSRSQPVGIPPLPPATIQSDEDLATAADRRAIVDRAMESLPAEERVAIQLYVVEELPAADVARLVGWPNPKAVYNRVYRALEVMRRTLALLGIGPGDL